MLSVDLRVGRLLESRGRGAVSIAEMQAFRSSAFEKMVRAGRRVISVVDMREVEPLAQDVGAMFLGLLRGDNALIEKAAHLAAPGSPYILQAKEWFRIANHPERQLFTDPAELLAWVSPNLTPAEAQRLREFLQGRPLTLVPNARPPTLR